MMAIHLSSITARARARIIQEEEATARTLTSAHTRMVTDALAPALMAFSDALTSARAAHEEETPLPLSWLYTTQRLAHLTALITLHVDQFATFAQVITTQTQQHGVTLGSQTAHSHVSAKAQGTQHTVRPPHPAHVVPLVNTAPGSGEPLSTLFVGMGEEAAQTARATLVLGVSLDTPVKQIVSEVISAVKTSLTRALTVAKHALITSFRGAMQAVGLANSDTSAAVEEDGSGASGDDLAMGSGDGIVTGWLWISELSRHTCAACTALHGTWHPLDEAQDSHVSCRCIQEFVTSTDAVDSVESGSDWFDNQDESVQRDIIGTDVGYDLYASGQATLSDFLGVSHDPTWGRSIYQRSAKEIMK